MSAAANDVLLSRELRVHLCAIRHICEALKTPVEGNCFTQNGDIRNELPELKNKQLNLLSLGAAATDILEIGFNAGHSALLFLMASATSRIVCFDICTHPYTIECFRYLDAVFPGRLELVQGDSQLTVSDYLLSIPPSKTFDVVHIDGCHFKLAAHIDFLNCYHLASKYIIWDDSNCENMASLMSVYIARGIVAIDDSFLPTMLYEHAILQVVKHNPSSLLLVGSSSSSS